MANPRFEEEEDKDALFVVSPADQAVDGVGQPLSERPNRDQPSPVKTDFQAFGMPAPGEDDGNQGNPLAEGVIMGKDGERPWKKGDNFMGSTKQSDLIEERTSMQPPLFFSAKELPEDPEFDAEDMDIVDPDDLPKNREDRKLDAISTSLPPQSAPAGGGASRPPGATPATPNSSPAPMQGVCPKCGQQEPCSCYTDPMNAGNGPADIAGMKQADVQKESIAPALAVLGGGLLRAAAPALLRGAMGAGAGSGAGGMGGALGRGLLMGGGMQLGQGMMGGGEQQQPQIPQMGVFQPETFEHFGSEYESPSSKPFPKDTDAEDVDQKEHDDGEREPLQVGLDVNGVGGTDSVHGLSDHLFDSVQSLLPKILDFYGSEESGENDKDLTDLAKKFDEEMPDWHNADDKHAVKFITVLMDQNPEQKTALHQPNLDPMNGPTTLRPEDIKNNAPAMSDRCFKCGGTIDPSDNSCPQCGTPNGNAIHQGSKVAEQLQGPQNDEQKALVAQFLQESGREDEIPSMILEPFKYAEELAEVIGRDAPPEGTGEPEPAIEEAPPGENMPVPNMQVPQDPQQAMARVIKRAEENHLQEHGDNFDNAIGVSPADEVEVEDSSKEQDSGHTWTDESGEPLKVGQEYEMFSANYDIPDMVRIEAVKPDSIEYTLTGEYGLEHQTEISREEALLEQLSFVPATQTHPDDIQSPAERDPGLEENMEDVGRPTVGVDQTDLSRPHSVMGSSEQSRDWLKEGGAKFTPMEQRDFIEEAGVARNADKLDLSGTHYEARVEVDDDFFLFGL